MRISLGLMCALSAVTAFGQTPPTILHLSRTQGSVAGGDVLLVYLKDPPYCDPGPCRLEVSFGGVPARFTGLWAGDALRVITPAHTSGNTDVTLSVNGAVVATYLGTFRFAGMREPAAPDNFNFETVLVPVAVGSEAPVEGAFGSRWTSELWVSNSGDADVEFFQGYPTCATTECRGTRFPFLASHSSQRVTFAADPTSAGYLFYVQKGGAENVHFSLRVRDISRANENAGTEVPAPRVSRLGDTSTILNVPIDPRSRTGLRIYGAGALPVRLRIFSMSNDALLIDEDLAVMRADLKPYGETHGFPLRSEYAQINDLAAVFPQLIPDRYRIEVTSSSHWLWALATVTNNDTQVFTVIGQDVAEPYGVVRD